MFQSFTIKNFRCFQSFTLESLERVNLIGGMNNAGKTSLLEALFIHLGPNVPDLPLRVNVFRGIQRLNTDAEALWGWLFFDKNTDSPIELTTETRKKLKRSLKISLVEPANSTVASFNKADIKFNDSPISLSTDIHRRQLILDYEQAEHKFRSSILITPDGSIISEGNKSIPLQIAIFLIDRIRNTGEDAERFSKIDRVNRQDEILKTLQILEPRLKRLAVLIEGGLPIIAGDIGITELVPISFMGEGMGRLLSIVLAIANAPNGTVLIDEIETGLHHSVLVKVWQAIANIARNSNTQIFATTHSLECIRAAHAAFESSEKYDFSYHRLERIKDKVSAVNYDRETISTSVEMNFEMR